MKKTSLRLFASVLVLGLGLASGCGGGGGSSHAADNPPQNDGGDGGGGNNNAVEGVSTPSSLSVVTAQNADQVQ